MNFLNKIFFYYIITALVGTYAIASYPSFDLQNIYGVDYVEDHFDQQTLGKNQPDLPTYSTNSAVRWESINHDFDQLSQQYNTVRLYDLNIFTPRVLRAAQRHHMQVILTIPCKYADANVFKKSFSLFQQIFTEYPELQNVVTGVIVGNEQLTADMELPNGIKSYMSEVQTVQQWVNNKWSAKNNAGTVNYPFVTVSVKDVTLDGISGTPAIPTHELFVNMLQDNTPIFANVYPFWDISSCTPAQAAAGLNHPDFPNQQCLSGSFADHLKRLQEDVKLACLHSSNACTSHPIIVGETGWPSTGVYYYDEHGNKQNSPSLTGQSQQNDYFTYIHNHMHSFHSMGVDSIFDFMSYDEPLKGKPLSTIPTIKSDPQNLRNHWGLWTDGSRENDLNNWPGLKNSSNTTGMTPLPAALPETGAFVNVIAASDDGNNFKNVTIKTTVNGSTKVYDYNQWKGATGSSGGYIWIPYNATVHIENNGHSMNGINDNTLSTGHGVVSNNLKWGNTTDQTHWNSLGISLPVASSEAKMIKIIDTHNFSGSYKINNNSPINFSGNKDIDIHNLTLPVTFSITANNTTETNSIKADGTWENKGTPPMNFTNPGEGGQPVPSVWI